jgi:adenylate cyclase
MAIQGFVARQTQLAELNNFLDRATKKQGQVAFVVGEAGSGKTALVSEFAREVEKKQKDLVIVVGNCNAHTGFGDPYLPFREILAQLTGDFKAKLDQGAITRENARRLQALVRWSCDALMEFGPDLINLLVPGSAMMAKAGKFVVDQVGWPDKLKKFVENKVTHPSGAGLEQSHIFEQYTKVLQAMASKRSLVLVLDDLQWADSASTSLLFHLGRRIGEDRILVLGAYRPEEVMAGRGGDRHPMEKVLAEFKRYFGDIWVDLDQVEEKEARLFVDALLDLEPNRLGENFRQDLVRHTGGHPLFAVELLRDMQEEGDLEKDRYGFWVEGPELDWDNLPPRVEGVIEERIGRLEEELQEILTVGSVEGEEFTAEVIARVQAVEERGLIQRLSNTLDKEHHLVVSQGIQRLDEQRLSSYRFRHNLFQKYLYNNLDEAQKAYLHEDVGNILEALYGEQTDRIAVQLARHFDEAGATDKARHYLQRAGELAYERFAHEEAIYCYSYALKLTPETEFNSRFELLLAREKARYIQGERELQKEDIEALEQLAEAMKDDRVCAEAALRRANYAEATGDYPSAISAVQRGIELADRLVGDERAANQILGTGHLIWGTVLRYQFIFNEAQSHLEQALQHFEQIGAEQQKAVTFRILGNCFLHQGMNTEAAHYFQQSLNLCQVIGDKACAGGCLNNLGIVHGQLGQHDRSLAYFQQALTTLREVGDRRSEAKVLNCLGTLMYLLGRYHQAIVYNQQALQIHREVDDLLGQVIALTNLAEHHERLGDLAEARTNGEQGLALARAFGERKGEARISLTLFSVSLAMGELAQAQTQLEQAIAIEQELGTDLFNTHLLACRANLALAQGRLADAHEGVTRILPQVQGTAGEIGILLVCYKVLREAEDPQAMDVLKRAFDLLQEQAARISDEESRRSFLENVVEHKEIVGEWEKVKQAQPTLLTK